MTMMKSHRTWEIEFLWIPVINTSVCFRVLSSRMRLLLVGSLLLLAGARAEDEAEGEDGVQFEDDTIYRAVVESCSG